MKRLLAAILVPPALVMAVAVRATASVPPPTPVPPNGSPSPFPSVLHTPRPSLRAPVLEAPSAILEDLETGQVLYRKGDRVRRPVASLTKIMTALLVLEQARPSALVTVGADAASQTGSSLGLEIGERISVRNLLYALLLQSSNDAAVALADFVSGSVPRFVRLMNRRAEQIGLGDTHFASPNGLDDLGYSTAFDMAAITRAAYGLPSFGRIAATRFRDIPAPSGPARHIQNRNALLWLYRGATGVKTGFTTPSGHCLIGAASRRGLRMLAIALGDRDESFDDAASLLNFGFFAFQPADLVTQAEPLTTLTVQGQSVTGLAGDDLTRLVRRDAVEAVSRTFVPADGLTLPIAAGQQIGREIVRADGARLGSVPVLAAAQVPPASPPPPAGGGSDAPPPSGPEAAVALLVALLRALLGGFL
jgi:D-alanyl-D-alanine carboxypeptidase (penicillin-binding protein 5/6)